MEVDPPYVFVESLVFMIVTIISVLLINDKHYSPYC